MGDEIGRVALVGAVPSGVPSGSGVATAVPSGLPLPFGLSSGASMMPSEPKKARRRAAIKPKPQAKKTTDGMEHGVAGCAESSQDDDFVKPRPGKPKVDPLTAAVATPASQDQMPRPTSNPVSGWTCAECTKLSSQVQELNELVPPPAVQCGPQRAGQRRTQSQRASWVP